MFTSNAYAQAEAGAGLAGGFAGILGNPMIVFVFMIGVFYLLIIRPQQKKQKELMNTLKSLKSGDKVITVAGIYGTIDSVGENNTYYVTIASGIKIHMMQSGIAGKVNENGTMTTEKKK